MGPQGAKGQSGVPGQLGPQGQGVSITQTFIYCFSLKLSRLSPKLNINPKRHFSECNLTTFYTGI